MSFHFIHVFHVFFACLCVLFSGFEANIFFFSFVISCSPIQLYRVWYMGKTEIWSFSTSLQPDIFQGRAVILHILQAMLRRKIVKVVNLGRKIENDKKWNEEKLGPCMNFLNFNPCTTLNMFHPKQWLHKRSNIKEIETWKVANRLWNGKMIKKRPTLKANSVLRVKSKANADQGIW